MVDNNQIGHPATGAFEANDHPLEVAVPLADEVSKMFGYANRNETDILETVARLFEILCTICNLREPKDEFFEKYPVAFNSLQDWRIGVYDILVQEIHFLFRDAEEKWDHQQRHMLGSVVFRFISEIPWYHIGHYRLLECMAKWMKQKLFTDEIKYQSHTQFVLLSIGGSLESDILVGLEAKTWNGEGSRWVNLQAFMALLYGHSPRGIRELDNWSLSHIFYTIDCGLYIWREPGDALFEEHITVAALWLTRAWPRLHRTIRRQTLNIYWERMATSPRSSNSLGSDFPEDSPKEFTVAEKCLEWASLLEHHGENESQIQDPQVRQIVSKAARVLQQCGDAYLDRWTDLIRVERGQQD